MSEIYVEPNIIIVSNDTVDWNQVFNKIKLNLKNFYYENLMNNCVDYLVKLFQLLFDVDDYSRLITLFSPW